MAKHAKLKSSKPEPKLDPALAALHEEPQESQLKRYLPLAAVVVAVIGFFVIYLQRLDNVVGMIVDDGWYVLLAKALATGHGYTLINSPTPGIVPFYAPGFPALLSVFYRLSPHFPDNVWLLKSVSMAAMLGVGVLTFFYFRDYRAVPRHTAFALAVAVAYYPALVFLATSSVMSECVFTLIQLGAILVIERCVREGRGDRAWRYALLGGALAGLAFLVRPAGVGLLIAAVLYLFKERLTRSALICGALMALTVGPWTIYSRTHAPTPAQRVEQGANIVQTYTTQFWQRVAGQPLQGTITFDDVPSRLAANFAEIVKFDAGGVAFYPLFRPLEPGDGMRIGADGRAVSMALALLALFGFVWAVREKLTLAELMVPLSLGVAMLWGWEQFRLLLPLVPFILFYLLNGLRGLAQLYYRLYDEARPKHEWTAATVLAGLMIAATLYSHSQYIAKKNDPARAYRLRWLNSYEENEALLKYVGENVPKDAALATQNPALVHLYTGHKTVAADDPANAWETWKQTGVRYLVRTSPFPLPPTDANESKFRVTYRQPGPLNLRVIDLGEAASRQPWK